MPAGDDAHRQCGSGKLATRAELGVQAEERGPKCSLDCVLARAVKLGQRAAKLQRKAVRQRSGGELGSCGAVMAVDDGVQTIRARPWRGTPSAGWPKLRGTANNAVFTLARRLCQRVADKRRAAHAACSARHGDAVGHDPTGTPGRR